MNNSKSKRNNKKVWGISIVIALLLIVIAVYGVSKNDTSKTSELNSVVDKNDSEKQGTKKDDTTQSKIETTPTNENETEVTEESTKEDFTNNGYIEGQPEPTEPTYVEGVLIANKKYPLPKNFSPGEDKTARAAFEQMAADARVAGFELVAFSTYRSYEYQETLYNNYVSRDGKDNADRYSARPGYSEHQTGLAFDIGEKGREDLWLTEEFGETEAGKWLVENADKYGFILRYPKDKETITGYMYESWHFRYLGTDLAAKVKESGQTLEEYLNIK